MKDYFIQGPVYGTVTANDDPVRLGRVKVKIDVPGEDIETGWIHTVAPLGGETFIPEINDLVVVAFMDDNPDDPVVLGCLWSDSQLPPVISENMNSDQNRDGENDLKFIKNRSGETVILDDDGDEEKIRIISADGKVRYEFQIKGNDIKLKADFATLLSSEEGLTISAEDITISPDGTIQVEGGRVSIERKKNTAEASSQQARDMKGPYGRLN